MALFDWMHDPDDPFENVDPKKVIFITPQQVIDMNMDYPVEDCYSKELWNKTVPFMYEMLELWARLRFVGGCSGSEIEIELIGDGDISAKVALLINGKVCFLNSSEWDLSNPYENMTKDVQVRTFQRLIAEGQITLEDLEKAGVDTQVYKTLYANTLCGKERYERIKKFIDVTLERQQNDPKMQSRLNTYLRHISTQQ